jgi:hypothetical protein
MADPGYEINSLRRLGRFEPGITKVTNALIIKDTLRFKSELSWHGIQNAPIQNDLPHDLHELVQVYRCGISRWSVAS